MLEVYGPPAQSLINAAVWIASKLAHPGHNTKRRTAVRQPHIEIVSYSRLDVLHHSAPCLITPPLLRASVCTTPSGYYNFSLSLTNNLSNPFLKSSFIPFAAGLPVSRSTNTWMSSPTALTSSAPFSKNPTSYVTLLFPSLFTLRQSSATAGKAIDPKKSLCEWTMRPYCGDVGGCKLQVSMR
jgi:hypothetical protein